MSFGHATLCLVGSDGLVERRRYPAAEGFTEKRRGCAFGDRATLLCLFRNWRFHRRSVEEEAPLAPGVPRVGIRLRWIWMLLESAVSFGHATLLCLFT